MNTSLTVGAVVAIVIAAGALIWILKRGFSWGETGGVGGALQAGFGTIIAIVLIVVILAASAILLYPFLKNEIPELEFSQDVTWVIEEALSVFGEVDIWKNEEEAGETSVEVVEDPFATGGGEEVVAAVPTPEISTLYSVPEPIMPVVPAEMQAACWREAAGLQGIRNATAGSGTGWIPAGTVCILTCDSNPASKKVNEVWKLECRWPSGQSAFVQINGLLAREKQTEGGLGGIMNGTVTVVGTGSSPRADQCPNTMVTEMTTYQAVLSQWKAEKSQWEAERSATPESPRQDLLGMDPACPKDRQILAGSSFSWAWNGQWYANPNASLQTTTALTGRSRGGLCETTIVGAYGEVPYINPPQ